MSIRIKKQGLLDTIQDAGRFGYQHFGISPAGAMDMSAMRIANALVGNSAGEPVIEMHFPAPEILFEKTSLIALGGADFTATIDEQPIPVFRPLLIKEGAVLRFHKQVSGATVYIAAHRGWDAKSWLESYSTNLEVKAGGYHGKALRKNDQVCIKEDEEYLVTADNRSFFLFPWWADIVSVYNTGPIRIIPAAEYERLDQLLQQQLLREPFMVDKQSNRMGYRLKSVPLQSVASGELISTAVTKGTIQLLPDGQLIILMADHQTTGGYPRIGHVIGADIPSLAQKQAGQSICFEMIDLAAAETIGYEYERNLQQLENACNFRVQEYLNK
jgi:antagonist of KipI